MKFSIIIPYWNRPSFLKHCLMSLIAQQFKDFEIIIIGEKVFNEKETIHNGIKITNIEYDGLKLDDLNLGKMMNIAVKESTGEYLQFWQSDFTVFQNFLLKLNSYIEKYGDKVLYVNRVLDIRIPNGDSIRNEHILKIPEVADHLDSCIHRSKFEPFYEGFYGCYNNWYSEWLCRIWQNQKLTFLYFNDLEIIHAPHYLDDNTTVIPTIPKFKLSTEMQIKEAELSSELYNIMKYQLGLRYELYYLLDEKSIEIKNKIIELRKNAR